MIFAEAERCNSPRLPSLNGRGFPASKPPVQSPDRQAPANIPVPNAPIAHEEVETPYTVRQNVGLRGPPLTLEGFLRWKKGTSFVEG